MTTPSSVSPNAYCERLGVPVPDLDEVLDRKRLKLFHAVIVALLEHGAPMKLDELVERLLDADVYAPSGDMATSIQKAWHGLPPVVKDRDGRYALDVELDELRWMLYDLGVKERPAPTPRAEPPKPEIKEPGDDVPLTKEELDAALDKASYGAASTLRRVAAVLDAHGRTMPFLEVTDELKRLGWNLKLDDLKSLKKSELVLVDGDNKLSLRVESPDVPAMRRAIRKLAYPVLQRRAEEAIRKEQWKTYEVERRAKEEQAAREAEKLRRAVIRVFPESGDVKAAVILDVQERTLRTFVGEELAQFTKELAAYDVLVGLNPRDTLQALGVDGGRFKLIDLKPPQKTRQLNRSGRKLTITTEMLISGTVGISRALGDKKKTAAYLAKGDVGKLTRRLESDAKHLFAYWSYGVLHNHVNLQWGFLREGLGVSWALPGDKHVSTVLKEAASEGRRIDLVLGLSAPGWENPWSRARTFTVIKADMWAVTVSDGRETISVPHDEIQALRLTPG